MASEDGGDGNRRRKRPWRKPREAKGPGDSSTPTVSSAASESQPSTATLFFENEDEGGSLPASKPLEVDGSVMEGGGQILRNAMAMSCLLGMPVHVTRIRAGRTKPGLRPQHMTGLQLLRDVCNGELEGDTVGSTDVSFAPKAIGGGDFIADTETAGSICLLLQAVLPCLLFAPHPSHLTLKGGTNADMAPPIDYLLQVFKPIAAKFGVNFECQVKRRGFYPRGGGELVVIPQPVKSLSPVQLTDPGTVTGVTIHSFVAGAVPFKVAKQMVRAAKQVIEKELPRVPVQADEIQETPDTAFANGSGIIAIAETSTGCILAGSANGRGRELPDKTGRSAGEELVRNVVAGGCVDEHLQDQLIILMALSKGKSTVRTGPLTQHTRTAIHVAELMTKAKFTVQRLDGEVHLIECDGIGLENQTLA